jgi:protein SCO1/2
VADRRRSSLVLGLAIAAVVAVVLVLTRSGGAGAGTGFDDTADDGMHGAVLTSPYRLADATLTDTQGRAVDLRSQLTKPLTLVFFGYSRCPDICQAVMADLASTVARLDPSEASRTAVWFVTTDPARDDAQTLRTYLARFDPTFEGFTGPLADIKHVAGSVHVALEQGPKLPSGGYDITHSTPVLAVRRDGSVPMLWTAGTSAARIAGDVQTILTSGIPSSSPRQG